ncbi:MAG: TetR/AcrR family transcriptional regulator [Myxococcota bacterium]
MAAREAMYRSVVLDAAERVFGQAGYHAAKMQDLAREAGISLNTLYATFPSKREVFEALHETRGLAFLERVSEALEGDGDARARLARGVHAFVDYLSAHPDYFRVDLREGRSWAIGDVEASPTFQAGIESWTRLVREGIARGVFVDEDPHVMAVTAFGVMQIQLAAWLSRPDPPEPRVIAERITRQLERALGVEGAAR